MRFQTKYSLEQRSKESSRIIEKYPDKIPIICEKYNKDKSLYTIDKNKFLAGGDLTMGQFIYVIRKRIKMKPEEGLYLFIDNTLLPNTELLSNIYKKYKNEDGFLYVLFSLENTFG
tara:strand:- start:213 stop:560 length:348 start_codon:yes stop_codon:yes gene_type:complete